MIAGQICGSPHSLTIITIATNIQVGIAIRKKRVAASVGAVKWSCVVSGRRVVQLGYRKRRSVVSTPR